MKLCWFHLMPYRELPDDFREKNEGVWVTIDSELFDATRAHHMYNDFMDELEHAAELALYREPAEYFYGRCLHLSPRYVSPPGYTSEATIRARVQSMVAQPPTRREPSRGSRPSSSRSSIRAT
jgi:hypothetical protein